MKQPVSAGAGYGTIVTIRLIEDDRLSFLAVIFTVKVPAALSTARFVERMAGFSKTRNVMTSETLSSISTLQLPAKTAVVLELLKQLFATRSKLQNKLLNPAIETCLLSSGA